jgi:hypothetical protein
MELARMNVAVAASAIVPGSVMVVPAALAAVGVAAPVDALQAVAVALAVPAAEVRPAPGDALAVRPVAAAAQGDAPMPVNPVASKPAPRLASAAARDRRTADKSKGENTMEKKIIIDQNLCEEIERLQYETNARKDVIAQVLSGSVTASTEAMESYQAEYVRYYGALEAAKAKMATQHVPMGCSWSLDFATKTLTFQEA